MVFVSLFFVGNVLTAPRSGRVRGTARHAPFGAGSVLGCLRDYLCGWQAPRGLDQSPPALDQLPHGAGQLPHAADQGTCARVRKLVRVVRRPVRWSADLCACQTTGGRVPRGCARIRPLVRSSLRLVRRSADLCAHSCDWCERQTTCARIRENGAAGRPLVRGKDRWCARKITGAESWHGNSVRAPARAAGSLQVPLVTSSCEQQLSPCGAPAPETRRRLVF